MRPPTLDDIRAAAERISPFAHRTPTVASATLDALAGRPLVFKCECFQKVGAFKFRGACNAIMKLDEEAARRGVVTHSSGNHAQAVALAARLRGISAHIVMPEGASRVKVDAVRGYGARIHFCPPTAQAREEAAARLVAETGATLIPPYDHPDVIAGQGTLALELLEAHPELEAVVAPVGGGGMLSGVTIAAKGLKPNIRVFGAEPRAADDAARSKASGQRQALLSADTVADGLRTGLGDLTWPVVRDLVDAVVTVEEGAIVAAMRLAFERLKVVIEPSAAVALAAAIDRQALEAQAGAAAPRGLTGGPMGVVLSGGNVDLDRLPWLA